MKKPWGTWLLLVAIGYVVAVLVAVIVAIVISFGPAALPDNGAQGSVFRMMSEFLPIMWVGLVYTFPFALPGFIVAIYAGERWRWNYWLAYAAAGFANALPAHLLCAAILGSLAELPLVVFGSFVGGFFGGLAYWLVVGRRLAQARAS